METGVSICPFPQLQAPWSPGRTVGSELSSLLGPSVGTQNPIPQGSSVFTGPLNDPSMFPREGTECQGIYSAEDQT